jgi:hypothetical protein
MLVALETRKKGLPAIDGMAGNACWEVMDFFALLILVGVLVT